MAQVSSDNSTNHKHNKPVAVAQDRDEVLSFSIRNSNDSKRKIGNDEDNNDTDDDTSNHVHGDESIVIQRRIAAQTQLCCWCTFHDFRVSTIQEHPSLIWLGPSSMAVYWYKEYLQTPINKQGWIRIPKEPSLHPATAIKGTTIRTLQHKVERNKPQQQKKKKNSKGNFYFIPGQYLRPDPPDDDGAATAPTDTTTSTTTSTNNNSGSTIRIRMMIQTILKYGIPDMHYATSYIGVYNLIRSYGRFIKISKKNQNQNNNDTSSNSTFSGNKRRRCNKEEQEEEQEEKQQQQQHQKEDDEDMYIVVPFDYKGPDLIVPKEQQDD